jgi:pimeloyl-ACP methyl ester carboxylesterase
VAEHLRIPTTIGTFDALADGPTDGRPILFLHGFPEAAAQWEFQLGALGAAGCRAVAPDQRGYSPDARPAGVADYALDELAEDVLAIADWLGWARFDLVGHDWGAVVAWTVAAAHPGRVRTLTAVSVPHPTAFAQAIRTDEDQMQRSAYLEVFRHAGTAERRLLADGGDPLRRIFDRRVPRGRIEDYVARLTEPGALTAALNWYRANKLSTVDVDPVAVPTLYVWGTDDSAVGSVAALAAEKYVTGPYRFEMLEEISHWVPEEGAALFTPLLMRHLLDHSHDW